MPRIQNVAYYDIITGNHMSVRDAVLIQIVDPTMDYPIPKSDGFTTTIGLKFLDLDERADSINRIITNDQAEQLVGVLQAALDQNRDVVVHCVAGMCRSGAVAEVGELMGFDKSDRARISNTLVKRKMMCVLGWTYG